MNPHQKGHTSDTTTSSRLRHQRSITTHRAETLLPSTHMFCHLCCVSCKMTSCVVNCDMHRERHTGSQVDQLLVSHLMGLLGQGTGIHKYRVQAGVVTGGTAAAVVDSANQLLPVRCSNYESSLKTHEVNPGGSWSDVSFGRNIRKQRECQYLCKTVVRGFGTWKRS